MAKPCEEDCTCCHLYDEKRATVKDHKTGCRIHGSDFKLRPEVDVYSGKKFHFVGNV